MKKTPIIARMVLGAIFLVFGLNGFFNFIPSPQMPDEAGTFLGGLAGSGYFFPMLKTIEILAGFLLLVGSFVPLAIVMLAPIVINITMFHLNLAPQGLPLAVVLLTLLGYLAFFAKPYCYYVNQIFKNPKVSEMLPQNKVGFETTSKEFKYSA